MLELLVKGSVDTMKFIHMANKNSTLFLYRCRSHSFHKVYISAKSGYDSMIRIIFKLNTSATACMIILSAHEVP